MSNFVVITSDVKDYVYQIALRLRKYGTKVILLAPKPIDKDAFSGAFDAFFEVDNINDITELSSVCEKIISTCGNISKILCYDTELTENSAIIREKYNISGITPNTYETYCTRLGLKHLFAMNGLPLVKFCTLDSYERALSFLKLNKKVVALPTRQEKKIFSYFIENEHDLDEFLLNNKDKLSDFMLDMCVTGDIYVVAGIFQNNDDITHKDVFYVNANITGLKENPLNFTSVIQKETDDSLLLLTKKILKIVHKENGFFNFAFIKLDSDIMGVGFKAE